MPKLLFGTTGIVKGSNNILANVLGDNLDINIVKLRSFLILLYYEYKLNLTLRNEKNEILAEIKNNTWSINPNLTGQKNFTKDAFELLDTTGDVILQVRLVDDAIKLNGKFYNEQGSGVAFVEDPITKKGQIKFVSKGNKFDAKIIKPIFEYPTLEYPGKLIE